MKKFIIKYYVQLIIIAFLCCAVVFVIYESNHVFSMIKDKSVELKKTQLDQVIAAEFLQNVHTFKGDASYIDEHITILNVLLPNSDDEKVRLFSELERLANDTGNDSVALSVKVAEKANAKTTTKQKQKEKKEKEKMLSMNITLVGSYNNLLQFVHKIENMQYFTNIVSFNITKTKNKEKVRGEEDSEVRKNLLKTDMVVNFYLNESG
ncbi:MAG: hypothetical protein CR972_02555 [Candidatus Moraniibacteriota bacterium]|nr:MAG: hypothetical protein CR972_02555 [Candidatus Moranbacteria bacterium]